MAQKCEICGKGPHYGNVVSHANNKRRRRWNPNLRRVRALVKGARKQVRVCTACLAFWSREEGCLNQGSRIPPRGGFPMRKRVIVAVAFLPIFVVAGCRRDAAPAPDVWAVVNNQEVHRAEAEKYYQSRLNPQSPAPSQDEALSLTLNVLDELINNDIMIQRAEKLGLQATDGEVEDKFTEFKSPYTEDEFQRQLKATGATVDDLKQNLRSQISVDKLINREIVAKISITDQDVADFFDQNRAQFNIAETQYHIAQILVTPHKDAQVRNRKNDDATTDIEAHRKAAALLQQLMSGADFSELAMDYSEDPMTASSGGDLGFVPECVANPDRSLAEESRASHPRRRAKSAVSSSLKTATGF